MPAKKLLPAGYDIRGGVTSWGRGMGATPSQGFTSQRGAVSTWRRGMAGPTEGRTSQRGAVSTWRRGMAGAPVLQQPSMESGHVTTWGRGMSGVSYQNANTPMARGAVTSWRSMGSMEVMSELGDTYTSATPCGSIPVGNAYRVPGNLCLNTDSTYATFDVNGNVVAQNSGVSGLVANLSAAVANFFRPASAPVVLPSTGPDPTTLLLLGGAAIAAILILKK